MAGHSHSKISKQVNVGFNRRNLEFIKETFEKHRDETGLLAASSLESVLRNLGINVHSAHMVEVIQSRGLNLNGADLREKRLDFEEFLSLVKTSSPMQEWIRAMNFTELIADALPQDDVYPETDQLRHLSRVSKSQIKVSIGVIRDHIGKILLNHLDILKKSFSNLDRQVAANNAKFQITETMSVGDIENFHEGLAARIGKS